MIYFFLLLISKFNEMVKTPKNIIVITLIAIAHSYEKK
jgi:hypothetical protein